jgi:hypothetical protein
VTEIAAKSFLLTWNLPCGQLSMLHMLCQQRVIIFFCFELNSIKFLFSPSLTTLNSNANPPPTHGLQLINVIEFVAPKNEGTTTTEELIFRSTISCFIIQSQLPPREQLLFLNKVNPELPKNHQAQLQLMICIFFVSINQQK